MSFVSFCYLLPVFLVCFIQSSNLFPFVVKWVLNLRLNVAKLEVLECLVFIILQKEQQVHWTSNNSYNFLSVLYFFEPNKYRFIEMT